MNTVAGIAGSPRRNGNSATLMRAVLRGATAAGAETKEVYLNGLTFRGCQGCQLGFRVKDSSGCDRTSFSTRNKHRITQPACPSS